MVTRTSADAGSEGDGEVTAREELYEIAEVLREASENEKKFKALKEEVRAPFFELISEIVREEIPLARQTVDVEVDNNFDPQVWRAQNYPEWRIVALNQEQPGVMQITLEENEAFKKYTFIHNGFRYGRTTRMEGAGFDAEGFAKEVEVQEGQAEWNDQRPSGMVEALASCVKTEVVTTYTLDEAKAMKVMAEYPETVALFQQFTNPGTPKPALLPIKMAKEEDEA